MQTYVESAIEGKEVDKKNQVEGYYQIVTPDDLREGNAGKWNDHRQNSNYFIRGRMGLKSTGSGRMSVKVFIRRMRLTRVNFDLEKG
ncbi:MAG: hypothetical protein ACLVGL_02330 [Waltera sp.]